jgi:hypothetical protein
MGWNGKETESGWETMHDTEYRSRQDQAEADPVTERQSQRPYSKPATSVPGSILDGALY